MSIVFLKVKVKSLAAEARIIHREESLARSADRKEALRHHRIRVVRPEARHSLLAYAYLRGRSYRTVESVSRTVPDFGIVERMVKKFGPPAHNTSFEDWKKVEDKAA